MKKSEYALIVLVFGIVAFSTFILVNTFFGSSSLKPVDVEKAERIETSLVEPSTSVFTDGAINPTVKVKIGDPSGQQPFTIGQ